METKLILKKVNVVSVLERKPTSMQVLMPPHPNQKIALCFGLYCSQFTNLTLPHPYETQLLNLCCLQNFFYGTYRLQRRIQMQSAQWWLVYTQISGSFFWYNESYNFGRWLGTCISYCGTNSLTVHPITAQSTKAWHQPLKCKHLTQIQVRYLLID